MDLATRRSRYARRALVAGVLAVLSAITLYLAGLSAWFVCIVTVGLPAGYCLIDALMNRRGSESLAETGKFVLIAIALSFLWGAAVLGIAYLLSR
jgi:hypothetical protein